jgi:hypothetical protein
MRIDCQTYGHWKDLLICAMSCPYTFRCKQFAKWKEDEDNLIALNERVMAYVTKYPHHPYELVFIPIKQKKTKDNVMKQFVCMRDGEIALLTEEEITQRLLEGTMFDEIFELGRGMELQIRLVPAKKTKKQAKAKTDDVDNTDDDDEVEEAEEKENGAAKPARGKRKKASV